MHADKDRPLTERDAKQHEALEDRAAGEVDFEEEEEKDEAEDAGQKGAQKRYLLTLIEPGRQAEVVLGRAGVTLPAAVIEQVVEFEVEGDGAFRCALRREVAVDGVRFDEVIEGRVSADEVTVTRGVDAEAGPVRRLEATRGGVRAVTAPGKGPVLGD